MILFKNHKLILKKNTLNIPWFVLHKCCGLYNEPADTELPVGLKQLFCVEYIVSAGV